MCKKNELLGSACMAFGAGLLVSMLFSSGIVLALIGTALLLCGVCLAKRA